MLWMSLMGCFLIQINPVAPEPEPSGPMPTATVPTGSTGSPTLPPTGDTGDTTTLTGDTGDPPVSQFDLLFVIDNSCSMGDDQEDLASVGPGFLQQLASVDFHIGVVTTDLANAQQAGRLVDSSGVRVLDATTPYPDQVFTGLIRQGVAGSGTESGIGAAYLTEFVNQGLPENAGFRRKGAELHLIFVSDEDDQTPTSVVSLSEAVQAFGGLTPDVHVHALVGIAPTTTVEEGQRYLDLNAQLGGATADISDGSFDLFLDAVVQEILTP
ncbi:MAG: hypothetical protein AAGA48_29035 [Myxococcota bacterium]